MDEIIINLRELALNNEIIQGLNSRYFRTFGLHIPVEAPSSLEEFEDRLSKLVLDLHDCIFGLPFYLDFDERSSLKKDTSVKNLLGIAGKINKKFSEELISIDAQLDFYNFLKIALEQGFPFSSYQQKLLGIQIDLSALTKPQKKVIETQSAAQVYWHLEKGKIPTIDKMRHRLLDEESPICKLFDLKRYEKDDYGKSDSRTIRNWISRVFPKPEKLRKGRLSMKELPDAYFVNIVPIPGVFSETRAINFQKLWFVITCLTKCLSALGWTIEKIKKSKIIQFYREPLLFYPREYVDTWIDESQ